MAINTAAYVTATVLAGVTNFIATRHDKNNKINKDREDADKMKPYVAQSLQTFNSVNLIYVSALSLKDIIMYALEEFL